MIGWSLGCLAGVGRMQTGATPLHSAAWMGLPNIVAQLTEAGADVGVVNQVCSCAVSFETTGMLSLMRPHCFACMFKCTGSLPCPCLSICCLELVSVLGWVVW